MIVGNDVVDLTAPRARDRHLDERFVARVFTEAEREVLRGAADPSLALWRAWAAKEASYKVVSKALGGTPPPFAHRRFEVTWAGDGPAGRVRWEGMDIPVRIGHGGADPGYVHVLAGLGGDADGGASLPDADATVERLDRAGAPWAAAMDRLLEQLSERERASVHQPASAAVRIGARVEAARYLAVDPSRVEIVCAPGPLGRRPPAVLVDGAVAKVDVSLSHDGRWIAWALCRR